MKQITFSTLLPLIAVLQVHCQNELKNEISLRAEIGYAFYKSYDPLINYYNYSGHSLLPLKITGDYTFTKNYLFVSFYSNFSKLKPQNIQDNYYTYNYIKQWNTELFTEYYRKLPFLRKKYSIYAGVANNMSYFSKEEFYNNILFDYGEGYRKSYNFSLLDISANIFIQIDYKKSFLRIKSGYSLINLNARPNDNFVKQFGLNEGTFWILSTPKNHEGYQFSVLYQLNLTEKTGLIAGYYLLYHSFSAVTNYKYQRMLLLIGLNRKF